MTRAPYTLSLESRAPAGPRKYLFHAADGVCSKDSFRTPELLLLEELWDADVGDLLCPEANYGVVGTVLSGRADTAEMTESSARAANICATNARENDSDASVSLVCDLTTLERRYDTVTYAPKPYTALSVAKQRIGAALAVLRAGGALYLAASRQSGAARYEDCLDEVGAVVERVGKRGEYGLLEATRPAAYEPPTYLTTETIRPTVDGVELTLVTADGLFSNAGLDRGTRLLVETATIEDGDRVLDVCCGYGAIGAYAGRVADCDVWLSDDDVLATACAESSLRKSNVDGTVVTADCARGVADRAFDRVLCNPPTHAGEGVLSDLFAGIHSVLDSDGVLSIVHHRALDLGPHLSQFDTVERQSASEEHVVLDVRP